jgi:predicted SnoaL-like aldol condensation-catalyzing enzyme
MKLKLAAFLFFIFEACTPKQEQANTAITPVDSTAEKNKELVKRVYAEMANKQNYTLIDSFFAPNIFDHGALEGQQQGREGFKKAVTEFLGMFSQVEITTHEMIAEGDIVATRETWKVTNASTNKTLTGETMHFFRIKDCLITDEWSKGWEWLGL